MVDTIKISELPDGQGVAGHWIGVVIPATEGGTGLDTPTVNAIPIANGASPFVLVGPLTNGQLLIGSTGSPPVAAVPSNGTNISWVTGAGTLTANISGIISPTNGGTGVNNGSSTITIGGSISYIGAFAGNFTLTGTTNVTFPTSGTLATTGGVVNTITGTANRITIGGTSTNPTIDIAATYVGQTSITTLGTITTGTWNANNIDLAHGGTNASLTASNGGIFYSTATAGAILAGTATANQMLQSGASAAPAWSTATWPATTTINQLLYSSSANTVVGLPTANSSILVTSGAGVPSFTTILPSGLTIPSATFSTLATFTGGEIHNVTTVTTATYTALTTDFVIACNRSGAIALTLIASPVTGRTYRIKDISGAAATNNITVTPTAGNIDGVASFVINVNYQAIDVVYTGTEWSVL